MLGQFLVYLTRHSAVLLKRIKSELSKDYSSEHKLNLSDEKNEMKIGKAVDKLMDNIRIFSCFISDLCIYYYNLDNLMFLCQTATGDTVMINQNLFLTSELLANYFLDILFRSDSSNSIVEMARYQSRDQNELLATHVGLLRKVGCWSDLGLPQELLRDKSDFLAPDEAKSRQNLVINAPEMKETSRNNEQLDTDGDQSVVFEGLKPEKQDSTQLDTNTKNSKNQSEDKNETLGDFNPFYSEKSEDEINQLTFIEEDVKMRQGNPSFSLFKEYTVIQGMSSKPGPDQTLNETQDNLLILLNLKEDLIQKKDRDLFPLAIEVFKQLPLAPTPTKKLYILTSSVVCALQEMRQIYSEKNPETETKFKVTQEMVVSIMIYMILKAGCSDVLAEYKVMKVYFLLNKDYNHNTLIYLLKSAIKSINKLGVYHTRHSV